MFLDELKAGREVGLVLVYTNYRFAKKKVGRTGGTLLTLMRITVPGLTPCFSLILGAEGSNDLAEFLFQNLGHLIHCPLPSDFLLLR